MWSFMMTWWERLSFSAAFLWLILIVGILTLAVALIRMSRRVDVLDPPHWSTRRDSTEAAGKIRNTP